MSRGFRIHENQSFTEYSEPLLSGSGTQSMSVTTLLKEGKSDLLYQYERVISATEESCIEITTSNSKRLESSDVERLQWTIHLRDCALELKKSLERADSLAQAIHKRFQENDDDSTVSTTSGINNGTIAGGGGGGRRRDRHRRNFWEQVSLSKMKVLWILVHIFLSLIIIYKNICQLIRHHSSVKMAQRIGEHSSFNLDSYLEYGPKRKTRRLPREEKKLCNQPLPPIICEYTSFSSNKKLKGETEDGVDGRLIDVETGIGGNWTFSELDEIFNSGEF